MRFENMPVAAIHPCDGPAMVAAIDRLFVEGVDVRRPEGAPFQLKLPFGFNYYPTTGKIFRDGALAAFRPKGIDALLLMLREHESGPSSA